MENKKKNNQPKKPQKPGTDCGDGCKISEENK